MSAWTLRTHGWGGEKFAHVKVKQIRMQRVAFLCTTFSLCGYNVLFTIHDREKGEHSNEILWKKGSVTTQNLIKMWGVASWRICVKVLHNSQWQVAASVAEGRALVTKYGLLLCFQGYCNTNKGFSRSAQDQTTTSLFVHCTPVTLHLHHHTIKRLNINFPISHRSL